MSDPENNINCPNCEKNCPATAVGCGRGARYFEEQGIAFTPVHRDDFDHEEHVPHGWPWEHDERGPHGRSREHGRHGGHEEHGPGGREFRRGELFRRGEAPHGRKSRYPEYLVPVDPEDIEGLLMACARKLHAPHGRRFGSTQDRIIRILSENGGTMNQRTLQELLRIQPGSISEVLSKMEEKDLITRSRDASDRRAALITLKAAPECTERQASEASAALSVLSGEEKETLKALLKKILESSSYPGM